MQTPSTLRVVALILATLLIALAAVFGYLYVTTDIPEFKPFFFWAAAIPGGIGLLFFFVGESSAASADTGVGNLVGQAFLRLVVGGAGWMLLGAMAGLSGIPYGGSSPWATLFSLSTVVVIVWAFLPFKSLLKRRRDSGHRAE